MRTSGSARLALWLVVVTAFAALAMAAVTGCSTGAEPSTGGSGTASGGAPPKDYSKVEVRDYQGKKLSSIADEPENSIKGPQAVDINSYKLQITGLVATPTALSYDDVTSMHSVKKVIDLNCVEGWSVTYLWQGVLLGDLLQKAGGADPSAKVLIFHCVDGYTSSLPLDYVLGRNIILGYKMNGVTMPPERGYPFQVVAEDRFGYKWAKWVKEIEVSSDVNYLGYWEKRGYDNGAEIPFAK
jgi:DMSO/TMAO reductase YedYZ molybdopterin-dependent catalytic subunit